MNPYLKRGQAPNDLLETDGGIIAVPTTGVETLLVTYTPGGPCLIDEIVINVYDLTALTFVSWTLRVNGGKVFPWIGLRMPQSGNGFEWSVKRIFPMGSVINVNGIVSGAAGPVNVSGLIRASLYGGGAPWGYES